MSLSVTNPIFVDEITYLVRLNHVLQSTLRSCIVVHSGFTKAPASAMLLKF